MASTESAGKGRLSALDKIKLRFFMSRSMLSVLILCWPPKISTSLMNNPAIVSRDTLFFSSGVLPTFIQVGLEATKSIVSLLTALNRAR
ncbi:hypothetical protein D3C84_1056210 [compost metagenome]